MPEAMTHGMPAARASAANRTACSLQSPTLFTKTSLAVGNEKVGTFFTFLYTHSSIACAFSLDVRGFLTIDRAVAFIWPSSLLINADGERYRAGSRFIVPGFAALTSSKSPLRS